MIDLLPHRPPFRFVDSVEVCEPGRRIVAHWCITGDEAWLAGHFPGRPLVPGVLQIEALAQAGAIAVLADPDRRRGLPLLAGVEDARFPRMVEPGDEVRLDVEIESLGGRGGWGRAESTVLGATTCRARLFFVVAADGADAG